MKILDVCATTMMMTKRVVCLYSAKTGVLKVFSKPARALQSGHYHHRPSARTANPEHEDSATPGTQHRPPALATSARRPGFRRRPGHRSQSLSTSAQTPATHSSLNKCARRAALEVRATRLQNRNYPTQNLTQILTHNWTQNLPKIRTSSTQNLNHDKTHRSQKRERFNPKTGTARMKICVDFFEDLFFFLKQSWKTSAQISTHIFIQFSAPCSWKSAVVLGACTKHTRTHICLHGGPAWLQAAQRIHSSSGALLCLLTHSRHPLRLLITRKDCQVWSDDHAVPQPRATNYTNVVFYRTRLGQECKSVAQCISRL